MYSTIPLRQEPRSERIDIGNGLIMRWSTPLDKDNLIDCFADAFRVKPDVRQWDTHGRRVHECSSPGKNEYIEAATGRLMSGKHVVQSQYDIALVEDTRRRAQGKNPIVAAICMHQMVGYYGSIDITYGGLGAVGSHIEYRNRGLIRRLFLEMMHPVAVARGDLITFIIGIPHFYRLFGYEYAVPHKFGRDLNDLPSAFPPLHISDAGDEASRRESFKLREALPSDIPYLIERSTPSQLHCNAQLGIYYGRDFWEYIITVLKPETINNHHDAHHHAGIIVDVKSGKDVGITLTSNITGRWTLEVMTIDEDKHNYIDVLPSVLRQLKPFDRPYYECYNTKLNNNLLPDESETSKRGRGEYSPLTFTNLIINLTRHHPATKMLDSRGMLSPEKPPFRLYTRIHSLPKWIQKIAPILEERLNTSALKGASARIQLDFYRKLEGMSGRGLEILFYQGKFKSAEDWTPKSNIEMYEESLLSNNSDTGDKIETILRAGFAPMTFTRLVTGTMSVSELLERDSENYIRSDETKLILEILFPKHDHFVDLFWW
ncbi:hypothetical protein BGZ76_010054 [Entomortierella beljakovae]|nr:hypothetical protein BGZ76_010054 [Entomortierella beljakovae]